MPELDDFSEWFEFVHGEGGLRAGSVATPSDLAEFNNILQKKVLGFSADLSPKEASFVDGLVDLTARSIQYWIDRFGVTVPATAQSVYLIEEIQKNLSQLEELDPSEGRVVTEIAPPQDMIRDPQKLVIALANVTGSQHAIRRNNLVTQPMEELSRSLPAFIVVLAEHNEGLPVDDYLEGTFKNIQARYLLAES